jgi:hypothetical protein
MLAARCAHPLPGLLAFVLIGFHVDVAHERGVEQTDAPQCLRRDLPLGVERSLVIRDPEDCVHASWVINSLRAEV